VTDEDDDDNDYENDNGKERRRRRGTRAGLVVIALGLIGAVYIYFQDSRDPFQMDHAARNAMLHAFLYGVGGLLVILWFNRDRTNPESDGGGDGNS